MTENRIDGDLFEHNPENSFSNRDNHLTQSLYSELKQLRKKPKSDDHLPHSQNRDELLDKSTIVKVFPVGLHINKGDGTFAGL